MVLLLYMHTADGKQYSANSLLNVSAASAMMLQLQNLSGPGLSATVALPPLEALHAHDTFELDFTLSCPGDRDRDCPIWDHTVQLFVCCDDPTGHQPPCEPCNPTVWSEPYPSSSSSDTDGTEAGCKMPQRCQNMNLTMPSASGSATGRSSSSLGRPQCGRELGRWITPFRSAGQCFAL